MTGKQRIWNGIRAAWLGGNVILYVVMINRYPENTQHWIVISLSLIIGGFGLLDVIWSRYVGRVEQIFIGPRSLLPTRLAMFLGGAAAAAYGFAQL